MKNTIWALCATLLLAGCAKEGTENNHTPGANQIVFTSGGENITRTHFEDNNGKININWLENDIVGIYGAMGNTGTGNNFGYKAIVNLNNGSKCTFYPLVLNDIFLWEENQAQNFYAYHPYDYVRENLDPKAHSLSLPPVQTQSKENSIVHVPEYSFMKAAPATLSPSVTNPEGVALKFHNVFSVLKLDLKMSNTTTIDVPIKEIRLVSTANELAFFDGTIDLTTPIAPDYDIIPVSVDNGSKTLTLKLELEQKLTKSKAKSFYIVAAAGTHNANELKIEVVAIDNSVATIPITTALTLKSNRTYIESFTIDFNDFVAANPFTAELTNTTFSVGETLPFVLGGSADKVMFWSGMEGNDYAFRNTDRIVPASMYFSFATRLVNGQQRTPIKVKYSTDFDGTAAETNILAATWTDMNDQFAIPTEISGVDPGTISATASGVKDITQLYPAANLPLYIGFFYSVEIFDATANGGAGNGRTQVEVTKVNVDAKVRDDLTNMFTQDPATLRVLAGASYADNGDNTLPTHNLNATQGYLINFRAVFRPAQPRYAYAVTTPLLRAEDKNVGPDQPVFAKNSGEPQLTQYGYAFTEPGTYTITLVGESTTLTGVREVVKQFTVTIVL